MPGASFRELPHLLHDATLEGADWHAEKRALSLRFTCLRRGRDGASLCNEPVEVVVRDVTALAVAYDARDLAVRPSKLVVPPHTLVQALVPFPFVPCAIESSIDAALDEEAVVFSPRTQWFLGSMRAARRAPFRFYLVIDRRDILVRILIAAGTMRARAGGKPLPFPEWAAQYGAWWKGWKQHWDAKAERDGGAGAPSAEAEEVAPEDAMIPAGVEETHDESYAPPGEPPFELERTRTPAALLATLRDYFESLVSRDWKRRAQATRDPGLTLAQQTADVRARRLDDDFHWGYARAIDEWWIEGNRAYVRVRGIEHTMPIEGEPAENTETVWKLSLRRRKSRWVIVTWSQGWPPYGSAEKKPASAKPWLKRWHSGRVKS